MSRRRRLLFLATPLVVACAKGGANSGAASAGGAALPPSSPPPVVVTVAKTTLGPVERTVFVTGTLLGEEDVVLAAKAAGRVVALRKEVGDRAAIGETLVEIDRRDYELAALQARMALQESLARLGLDAPPAETYDPLTLPAVAMARTEVANAEARFRRGEGMFQSKPPLISEQEFSDLQAAFDVARDAYELAARDARSRLAEAHSKQADLQVKEHALSETAVRAPTAEELAASPVGAAPSDAADHYAVVERLVSVGQYVTTGTPLVRLVADRRLKFRASAPERFLKEVAVGQAARVTTDTVAAPVEGRVVRILPEVDRVSRSFFLEVALANPEGRLHAGSFGQGDVLVATDPAATFAPQDAVVTRLGASRVFVLRDGKAVDVPVKVGVRRGAQVEIVAGLAGEQEVIVSGVARLADGTPVTLRAAEPARADAGAR